jgi:hypothetical protein
VAKKYNLYSLDRQSLRSGMFVTALPFRRNCFYQDVSSAKTRDCKYCGKRIATCSGKHGGYYPANVEVLSTGIHRVVVADYHNCMGVAEEMGSVGLHPTTGQGMPAGEVK